MSKYKTVKNGFVSSNRDNDDPLEEFRLDLVRGDTAGVQAALARGIPVDTLLHDQWSPLMYACTLGYSDVARLLLLSGADPNINKGSYSPLIVASASRREESELAACARLLLDFGAEVDARDDSGATALMHAAREGHIHLVALLVRAGASLTDRDTHGWTALFWAIKYERKSVVRLLMHEEAKLYRRTRSPGLMDVSSGRVTPSPCPSPLPPTLVVPPVGPPMGPRGAPSKEAPLQNGHAPRPLDAPSPASTLSPPLSPPSGLASLAPAAPPTSPTPPAIPTPTINKHELCLYSGLKLILNMDTMWRDQYHSLDKLRQSIHNLAVNEPVLVRPLSARRLTEVTGDAVRTTERLYHQMRFLHRVAETVMETGRIIPAHFIVEKRIIKQKTWTSVVLVTVVMVTALWRSGDLPYKIPGF